MRSNKQKSGELRFSQYDPTGKVKKAQPTKQWSYPTGKELQELCGGSLIQFQVKVAKKTETQPLLPVKPIQNSAPAATFQPSLGALGALPSTITTFNDFENIAKICDHTLNVTTSSEVGNVQSPSAMSSWQTMPPSHIEAEANQEWHQENPLFPGLAELTELPDFEQVFAYSNHHAVMFGKHNSFNDNADEQPTKRPRPGSPYRSETD